MSTPNIVVLSITGINTTFLYFSPDAVSQKICEKIAEYFPNACLVLLNNRLLSKQMTQSALSIVQYCDGKWKVRDKEKYLIKIFHVSTVN